MSRELLEVALEIAREAGELLLQYVGGPFAVEKKGKIDLVTDADRASERLILQRIQEHFPEDAILAEEGGGRGGRNAPGRLWVVDPLDGTTNFAHGLPIWAVSIGVLEDGVPMAGVVHDPSRGETFSGLRGQGAFLNGRPIQASTATDLSEALLVTGFPYDVHTASANNVDHFSSFVKQARAVRRLGSAALDLCDVGCGRFDGFWEMRLHPWDVAAGGVIASEAGAVITDFAGADWDVFGSEFLVSTTGIAPAMREVLLDGRRPGGLESA
ncbi:MAG: inositol monophosphatase family protein [Gemmatimonadota bacterium]|nr:inositol monophosphatase family protein [Gemmatimonadota bacterium]